jgi:hypothetical protein
MATVQPAYSSARLGLIEDILVTAGWVKDDIGWTPPELYRENIEGSRERGQWSLPEAIKMMAEDDLLIVKIGMRNYVPTR